MGKWQIVMAGLFMTIGGLIPIAESFGLLPPTLSLSNMIYNIIILVVGVIGMAMLWAGGSTSSLYGGDRGLPIILAIAVICAGVYPFLVNFGIIPEIVPSANYVIPGVVIVLGIVDIIFGIKRQ